MSVKIYSTPSCGYCTLAKNYLRERNIKFTDYNVAADQQKAEEMVRKSRQMGVPVLDINGKIIVGFDREKINRLLNLSG
jgi:glutaredoxin-like YruB-family protein